MRGSMNWRFGVFGGLLAVSALSAPASATTIGYDLAGDATAGYTDPGAPGSTFIDLSDASTVSGQVPSHTVSTGDTLHVTLTLNQAINFTRFALFLQKAPGSDFAFDTTFTYFLGGSEVFAPSSNWSTSLGSSDAIGLSTGYTAGNNIFSFDKVVIDVVLTAMTSSPLTLPETWSNLEVSNFSTAAATTPLPGALLLMMTALGALGAVARRKRSAAA
jgi:hypothetical protein